MENMMIGRNGWKAAVLPIFRQTLNVYSDGASYTCFQHLLDGGRGDDWMCGSEWQFATVVDPDITEMYPIYVDYTMVVRVYVSS